jgi:nitroimidazol reductase NimA-like FMN-containing flavoprotein (pyridoxamine 5'-phosphate oxidase superfamily)
MSLTISMDSLLTDGQKIEWMRTNPKVCVEIDGITNDFQRTSVVVCGGYRELLDLPPSAEERNHARKRLATRSLWWQTTFALGAQRVSPLLEA